MLSLLKYILTKDMLQYNSNRKIFSIIRQDCTAAFDDTLGAITTRSGFLGTETTMLDMYDNVRWELKQSENITAIMLVEAALQQHKFMFTTVIPYIFVAQQHRSGGTELQGRRRVLLLTKCVKVTGTEKHFHIYEKRNNYQCHTERDSRGNLGEQSPQRIILGTS